MDARTDAALATSFGLITRQEALDSGLTPSRIAALVRQGRWVYVRRGVYAEASVWEEMDTPRDRHRLLARAATLTMRRGFVLSHDSSAHELGLDLLAPESDEVHITRPGYSSAWTRFGVSHHYAAFRADQVVVTDDAMRVLDAARTVVDVGREHGYDACVVAADSALRQGVTRARMIEAYATMSFWPHIIDTRAAIDAADAGAQNPAETLGRLLVRSLGYDDVETQFPVRDGDRVYFADLRVGTHLVEIDGKIKYRSRGEGGVADKPALEVLWDEKKRERRLRRVRLGLSRLFWEDYFGGRRRVAAVRLREEIEATFDQFGPRPDPWLLEDAARIRAAYDRPA